MNTTLSETEWFTETPQDKLVGPLLQKSDFAYKGPTSVAVLHPKSDSVQRSIQQHMKIADFLQAFQRPREVTLSAPAYTEPPAVAPLCPYRLAESDAQRLLQIPFPEELVEAVFEALQTPLHVLTTVKRDARVVTVSVNCGEFWSREERGSSQEARVAALLRAGEWAAKDLVEEWRLRHRR